MYWIHTTTQAVNLELVTDVFYKPPNPDAKTEAFKRPTLTLFTTASYSDEQAEVEFRGDEALAIWEYIKGMAHLDVNAHIERSDAF
jgi:hypothetical protein